MKRKLINKKEIVIIVLVLLACCGVFLYYGTRRNDRIAKITVNSDLYKEINLSTNKDEYVIDVLSNGKTAHIKVSGDKIGFINYECPDGICQNSGMMSSPLQTAVCLPLRVSVTIEESSSKLDVIAG